MAAKAEIEPGNRERKKVQGINISMAYRKSILLLVDMILINTAALAALLLRFDLSIPKEYMQIYLQNGIFTTAVMIITFYIFDLYQSVWSYASLDELSYVVGSSITGITVLFLVYNYILSVKFPLSIACIIISAILLVAPMMFVGFTALSVEISMKRFAPYLSAHSATFIVPKTLFLMASAGQFSISGTCLWAAA
jgi:FlaA1/EpsC-like NDP-sugar epimerase